MEIDLSLALARINTMLNGLIEALPNVIIALIVFALFFLTARVFQKLVQGLAERSGLGVSAGLVFGRLAQWVIVIAGFLVGALIVFPSLQAADVIELLGISGLAIGFAFRDVAQNFLAGILLLLSRPFRIGDQIVVTDFEGTVEDIQTRATLIRTYDGRRVVIPNTSLFVESVIVNTAADIRRSEYDVGISYQADIDLARRLILQAMTGVEEVLLDPAPDTVIVELDESTVNIRARWWTQSIRREVLTVRGKILDAIKRTLEANDIEMPYPIQTVLLDDRSGDRGAARP